MDQAKQTQFKAEFEENGKPRVSLIFMFLFFIQHTHTPHLFFYSNMLISLNALMWKEAYRIVHLKTFSIVFTL